MKPASRVDSLLSRPVNREQRIKSSFNLNKRLFDGFRALCEERGLTQSEVLDAMLEDLLNRKSKQDS